MGRPRSVKSGAVVPAGREDANFLPRASTVKPTAAIQHQPAFASLTAINFRRCNVARPSVYHLRHRITYFYGTGIRQISLNDLAERSFIFRFGSF
jgi:hypothetical protein